MALWKPPLGSGVHAWALPLPAAILSLSTLESRGQPFVAEARGTN